MGFPEAEYILWINTIFLITGTCLQDHLGNGFRHFIEKYLTLIFGGIFVLDDIDIGDIPFLGKIILGLFLCLLGSLTENFPAIFLSRIIFVLGNRYTAGLRIDSIRTTEKMLVNTNNCVFFTLLCRKKSNNGFCLVVLKRWLPKPAIAISLPC